MPIHVPLTPGVPVAVLVIDDSELVRWMTRRALGLRGWAVYEAINGAEGLAILDAGEPRIDLVITDIDMPSIDGIEVVTVLQRMRPELGIVCMTGAASPRREADLRKLRTPLLRKPFALDALYGAAEGELSRAAERRRARGTRAQAEGARAVAEERRDGAKKLGRKATALRGKAQSLLAAARALHQERTVDRSHDGG